MIEYIGKQWSPDGFGPEFYSCWGLLCEIELKHFNRKMPQVPLGDAAECRHIYQEALAKDEWRMHKTPEHGDGVMLRGGDSPHVGVWLSTDGGGVIHSLQGRGVIFSSVSGLRLLGMNRLTFYRPT